MPTLPNRTQQAIPVQATVDLPPNFPPIPAEIVERFKSASEWQDRLDEFWERANRALQNSQTQIAKQVNSQVVFSVDTFRIYAKGGAPQAMFALDSTGVKLGDVLTVNTPGRKIYIGAGNYADEDTPFYVDALGNFSLGSTFKWDAATDSLVISGTVEIVGPSLLITNDPVYGTWQGPSTVSDGLFVQNSAGAAQLNLFGPGTATGLNVSVSGGTFAAKTNTPAGAYIFSILAAAYGGGAFSTQSIFRIGTINAYTGGAETPYFMLDHTASAHALVWNYDDKLYITNGFGPNSTVYPVAPYVSDPLANLYSSGTGVMNTDAAFSVGKTLGIGIAPSAVRSIILGSSLSTAGGSASGLYDASTYTFAANGQNVRAIFQVPALARGGFTGTEYTGIYVGNPSYSGGGTIASIYGINISTMGSGSSATLAVGLNIGGITGGGTNYAISTGSGMVSIGDTTDATSGGAGSIITAGGIYAAKQAVIGGTLVIARQDAVFEGGEINLLRALDNAVGWSIDLYGAGTSPILRFFDSSTAVAEFSSGGLKISALAGVGTRTVVADASGNLSAP